MKKRLICMVLVLCLLMATAACGGGKPAATASPPSSNTPEASASETGSPETSVPEGDKPDIKIGHIVHMTGGAVESGSYEKQGAELAVEEINAAGGVNGHKLVLVQEDGQSSNPGVVAAFQKLLEDEEIVAIIGPSPSTQVAAMIPTITEAMIPVATGGTNYSLTHSDCPWIFRFRPHDGMSAGAMAKFVVEDIKSSNVAILHSTDAFGTGGRDMAVAALEALGVTPVLIQGYNNEEKDFTGVITALKQSGADAMISYMTFSPDLGIFAQQRVQQGLEIEWIGSPSITAVAGRNLAGEALYGTYGVADFHVDGNEIASAYGKAYSEKFGKDPDFYSSWTYDTVYIFAEAFKVAPDLEADSIREAILGVQGYEGAEGVYNFDENGDGLDSYHIVINENDEIKVVKTIQVER